MRKWRPSLAIHLCPRSGSLFSSFKVKFLWELLENLPPLPILTSNVCCAFLKEQTFPSKDTDSPLKRFSCGMIMLGKDPWLLEAESLLQVLALPENLNELPSQLPPLHTDLRISKSKGCCDLANISCAWETWIQKQGLWGRELGLCMNPDGHSESASCGGTGPASESRLLSTPLLCARHPHGHSSWTLFCKPRRTLSCRCCHCPLYWWEGKAQGSWAACYQVAWLQRGAGICTGIPRVPVLLPVATGWSSSLVMWPRTHS